MNTPSAPNQPLDLTESAAGEEDPGAAIDMPASPGAPDQPARGGGSGKGASGECPTSQGTGKVTVGIGGA